MIKPIHKFNNGNKATICHICRTIISTDFTDDKLCQTCQEVSTKEETIEEYYLSSIKNVLLFNNDAQAIRLLEIYHDRKCWTEETIFNTEKVSRVEVIQHSPPHNGRAYTNYNAKDVEIQLQDNKKTLKIFLK